MSRLFGMKMDICKLTLTTSDTEIFITLSLAFTSLGMALEQKFCRQFLSCPLPVSSVLSLATLINLYICEHRFLLNNEVNISFQTVFVVIAINYCISGLEKG